ncbi:long-chain acyl-CoA synthetase [Pseudohyphozyma bogoriensis]|nr:long-chain acyl-CoA synthetase [Pseudohyphozyma bogoriensis]
MTLPPGSIEVGPPAPKGEGRARRCWLTPDEVVSKPVGKNTSDIKVVADILTRSAELYPNKKALGWRDVLNMVEEEKKVTKTVGGKEVKETKKWSYFNLSEYKWWTYKEFATLVDQAASALVETGHSKDTIFNIYASTSPRWQLMANACLKQSVTFATAYDSLGEDGVCSDLRHSINEPDVYGLFTNANLLATVASVIDKTPSLKVLVYDGDAKDIKKGALETIKAAHDGGIKVFTLDEFLELGKAHPHEPNLPQPDDIATIMYTSGSTGDPKGVMISNKNIIAALAGCEIMLGEILQGEHYFLAYLPLAIPMGYGTVRTLTDTNVRNCVGDIREFKPTILIGYGRVLFHPTPLPSTRHYRQLRRVKAGGRIKSFVFHAAFAAKKHAGRGGYIAWLMDALVFKAVKEATGGRLILSCILHPDFYQYGSVGSPVPSCEIKLVDFEEANYYSTNDPPQGEVWLRGESITKGYYKRDDLTKEAWTEDGWHKTGDIGQWNPDGTLSIIDRKKNLVKLSGGEYIALERLESVYKSVGVVANICVYASSDANRPMAIIFPHEANLKSLASEKGISSGDFESLCHDEKVQKAVLAELATAGKKANLKSLETLQTVVLTPTEWTPQNGYLTAAQKLQRKKIISDFKKEIDAVYP